MIKTLIPGQRFGRLTAVERVEIDKPGRQRWRFKCDCGSETIVPMTAVKTGNTKSCGCLHDERAAQRARDRNKLLGKANHCYKHGLIRTQEYMTWRAMMERCSNPRHYGWRWYGGRGIKVCERWRNFENFLADMGPRPSPKHSIDRIDSNGNYEPGNCRWLPRSENTRRAKR